jgi:hypothetical protein
VQDFDYRLMCVSGCNRNYQIVLGAGTNVYSGLIDPSFRVIDPSVGGNNPEGRS